MGESLIRPMLAILTLEQENPLRDVMEGKSFCPMEDVRWPMIGSRKLDGVRCLVYNGIAHSRTGKQIPNEFVRKVMSHADFDGLEGELGVGAPTSPTFYRDTVSAIMSRDGEPDFRFYVFDYLLSPKSSPFSERMTAVKLNCISAIGPHQHRITPVEHIVIKSKQAALSFRNKCVDEGFEGAMLASPTATYKFGRATPKDQVLLKLKTFMDSEAEIVEAVEERENQNDQTTNELGYAKRSTCKEGMVPTGRLGALKVRDVNTGVEFSIGSGFDFSDREELWKIRESLPAKIVRYSYFPSGGKEKPRFPVYRGFRSKLDF